MKKPLSILIICLSIGFAGCQTAALAPPGQRFTSLEINDQNYVVDTITGIVYQPVTNERGQVEFQERGFLPSRSFVFSVFEIDSQLHAIDQYTGILYCIIIQEDGGVDFQEVGSVKR